MGTRQIALIFKRELWPASIGEAAISRRGVFNSVTAGLPSARMLGSELIEVYLVIKRVLPCLLGVLSLAACSSGPERLSSFHTNAPAQIRQAPTETRSLIARSSDHQKVGNPYVVAGVTYRPYRDDDYDEVGIASWYGPNFHGRPTANGEVFNQHEMTAAHTTLPIPSIVEVTNLENGRQVIVRLNDRGPFVDDRIIDMSRAAADALDFRARGLARVRVRYLGPAHPAAEAPDHNFQIVESIASQQPATSTPTPPPQRALAQANTQPSVQGGALTLQVGAFSDRRNADQLADRIGSAGQAWVEAGSSNGARIYRVYFGRWNDQGAADQARNQLADWGVYDARLIALD